MPKFLPKVRSKYPDETPRQTLDRLVKMWELHLKQANFGSRCEETCMCGAGWKRVFRRGDVFQEAPAKFHKGPRLGNTAQEISRPVPRKRPRADTAEEISAPSIPAPPKKKADVVGTHSSSFATPRVQPGAPRNPTTEDRKTKEARALLPYHVSYSTLQPLGFYCVTRDIEGKSHCVLTSVCPSGMSRKQSPLIKEGTCGKYVYVGFTLRHIVTKPCTCTLFFEWPSASCGGSAGRPAREIQYSRYDFL